MGDEVMAGGRPGLVWRARDGWGWLGVAMAHVCASLNQPQADTQC